MKENETLTIRDIATLKTGKKSLNRIQKDGNYPKYITRQVSTGIQKFMESYETYKNESNQLEMWMTQALNGRNLWVNDGSGKTPQEEIEMSEGLRNLEELNTEYDNIAESLDQLSKNMADYLNYKKLPQDKRYELERTITNAYAQLMNNERMMEYRIELMEEQLDKMNPLLPSDTNYQNSFYGRKQEYLQNARDNIQPFPKIRNNLEKAINNLKIPIEDLTTETGYIGDYPTYPETYWKDREV